MADPKYAGLPGITSEKDVYESGDLPEEDQCWIPKELSSEAVEKECVDTHQAYLKFNKKISDADNKILSSKLKPELGYFTREYSLGNSGEIETPLQKLQRLKIEAAELLANLRSVDKFESSIIDLVSQVKILEDQLSNFEDGKPLTGSFQSLLSTADKVASFDADELAMKPEKSRLYKAQHDKFTIKVSEMEARLAKLETAIGLNTENRSFCTSLTHSETLKEVLKRLEAKQTLINSERLPQIEMRLQAILSKVNDINKARKQDNAELATHDAKVNETFHLMQKWDSVCAWLPDLVNRLESLNELHQISATFSSVLRELKKTQEIISIRICDANNLVQQADAIMKENASVIQKNVQSLEKRVQTLVSTK